MSYTSHIPAQRSESGLPLPALSSLPFGTPTLGPAPIAVTSLAPSAETVGRPRRSRGRSSVEAVPLGSLTQRENRPEGECRECGSHHVTRLSLCLTDGTPVEFTSCHRCEHRTWEHAGIELTVDSVLDRSRKS